MMHKTTPSVDYNEWLKRLHSQLYEPTNQRNSIKVHQEVNPTIRKRNYETLRASEINSPLSDSSKDQNLASYIV